MKSQLSMLSDFASGFPTEIYYLNCINEICEITKWKNTTLIDIINKHASIFANNLEIRLNNTKLSNKEKDTIIKNATVKFKGNILEIIVEKLCRNNMFCDRYKLNFDYVIGSDNDNGIDIMMYYRDNPDWKVGMQIKFRTFEEIDDVGAVPGKLAADKGHAVPPLKSAVGPDVTAGHGILLRLSAFLEPGVLLAGVTGNQVQENLDAQLVGPAEKLRHIVIGAVPGSDPAVIPDIIARVLERGVEAGVQPQGVAAQAFHIGELLGDAGDVADAVPIGIPEALGIDLIKNRVAEPGCRHNNTSELCVFTEMPVGAEWTVDSGQLWSPFGTMKKIMCISVSLSKPKN